ncbi:MAG: DoxX family protein [Gammaproteobacteria bacterium]|jgi:putative oxidoreductase
MHAAIAYWNRLTRLLDRIGEFLPQLGLRFLIAWEFWESGVMKFNGQNWFGQIKDAFPFPFNHVPVDVSWFLSEWGELIGAIALVIGLGTRFFSFTLIIITAVAWYAVHAGNGYNVCSNGYKLPLIYILALLPLLFSGAGKASLDYLLGRRLSLPERG